MRLAVLLGVAVLLLAACGADKQPVALVIPTDTATAPTVFPTLSPTATEARTPTPTPTVVTATPRPTRDPAQAPTSPFGPTYTLAPATQTATFLPTRVGLEVEYFTTNIERVSPGATLTLFWQTRGAETVTIYRLDADGERDRFWVVNGEGRLTVNTDPSIPQDARFVLVAETSTNAVEQELVVSTDCAFSWGFQPAPEECPAADPLPTYQVEQRFERGIMLWLEQGQQIYVIYGDGESPAWEVVADAFQEGDPERDDSLQVPPERLQPVRGFGLVWRQNEQVRNRLGWAINAEFGYDGVIQESDDGQHLYLRTLDGVIIDLQGQGSQWEILPESPLQESDPPVDPTTITLTPAS